jgi:hypothetical protein
MPWGFVLFEFYDPIYEELENPSSALFDVTKWTEDTRRYMNQLVDAERSILAPLYNGRQRHWQGNKLGLFLKSTTYRILDHKRLNLPWLGHPTDWDIATTIRICGKLKPAASRNSLEQIVERWSSWLSTIGSAPKIGPLVISRDDFHVLCEFPEACGDACMSLYTAFIPISNETCVEAVGFFQPEHKHLRYLRIGKPGEVTAEI